MPRPPYHVAIHREDVAFSDSLLSALLVMLSVCININGSSANATGTPHETS